MGKTVKTIESKNQVNEANENALMKKTKKELVGFILRKDIVETNLMKKVSEFESQIKTLQEGTEDNIKIVEKLIKVKDEQSKHIDALQKDIRDYHEEIDNLQTDNVILKKKVNKYKFLTICFGIVIAIELIIFLI